MSLSACFSATSRSNGRNISQDVMIQDQHSQMVDLYLYRLEATTNLTASPAIDDTTLQVDSVANIDVGDALTIYECNCFYQSIVLAVGTSVEVASPLDCAFSIGTTIECGSWNMNVDGSSSSIIYKIKAPCTAKFDIYTVTLSITDATAMDSAKFGGISALSRGILFRQKDGITKNLPLIVNNIGFSEIGFTTEYDPKAPAGVYGFNASKNLNVTNGICIRLDGTTRDEFQIIIQDDLTDLLSIDVTINGHEVK